jgi:hypothetical protein
VVRGWFPTAVFVANTAVLVEGNIDAESNMITSTCTCEFAAFPQTDPPTEDTAQRFTRRARIRGKRWDEGSTTVGKIVPAARERSERPHDNPTG